MIGPTVVVSAFRNSSEDHVLRWSRQVCELVNSGRFDSVRAVAVVGDCKPGDETTDYLQRWAQAGGYNLTIVECNHGGQHFGSVEHPQRMAQLSKVGNAMLDSVEEGDEFVLYVESDLIWDEPTVYRLLSRLQTFTYADVLAPLVFAGEHFYDVWAFRLNGAQFSPFPPYHSDLDMHAQAVRQVDSVGSCLVMRGKVARNRDLRMTNGALVEWCNTARQNGYRIGVACNERVEHPR